MDDGESILAGQLICMSNSSRAICGLHTTPVDLGWVLVRWGGCDKCEAGMAGRAISLQQYTCCCMSSRRCRPTLSRSICPRR